MNYGEYCLAECDTCVLIKFTDLSKEPTAFPFWELKIICY